MGRGIQPLQAKAKTFQADKYKQNILLDGKEISDSPGAYF